MRPVRSGRDRAKVARNRRAIATSLLVDAVLEVTSQVGDRPRHTTDAVVAAAAEAIVFEFVAQQRGRAGVEPGDVVELVGRQARC